jgi:hypothetical protein
MITSGKVRAQDNEMANRVVDEGVKLFGKETVRVGAIMMKRPIQFSELVKHIHDHFITRFLSRNRICKERGIQHHDGKDYGESKSSSDQKKQALIKPQTPFYHTVDNANQSRALRGMIHVRHFRKITNKQSKAGEIQQFLGQAQWIPTEDDEEGINCFELYIAHKLRGGP